MKKLIIYHGGCPDGFTAAWACTKAFGADACELFAGHYGQPPPDVFGRDVYIVDFSYPRDVLLDMNRVNASLRVLDHHVTARDALKGLPFCTFDMERSGAGLTWDELVGGPRPWLVDYMEDRDLWRFKLPSSQHVSDCCMSFPYTLEAWDELNSMSLEAAVKRGAIVRTKIDAYCAAMQPNVIDYAALFCLNVPYESVTGPKVTDKLFVMPVVNAPQVMVSDLLHAVLKRTGAKRAAAWFQRADGSYQYGLRAQGDADVSEIAKLFGGGGHKQAAGFQVAAPVHRLMGKPGDKCPTLGSAT